MLPGRYMATDVIKMGSAITVKGQSFMICDSYGNVMVNNARITKTDIKTCNGVIHVIGPVILPVNSESLNPEPLNGYYDLSYLLLIA